MLSSIDSHSLSKNVWRTLEYLHTTPEHFGKTTLRLEGPGRCILVAADLLGLKVHRDATRHSQSENKENIVGLYLDRHVLPLRDFADQYS